MKNTLVSLQNSLQLSSCIFNYYNNNLDMDSFIQDQLYLRSNNNTIIEYNNTLLLETNTNKSMSLMTSDENPSDYYESQVMSMHSILNEYYSIYKKYSIHLPVQIPLTHPDYTKIITILLNRSCNSQLIENEINYNILPFSKQYNINLNQVLTEYIKDKIQHDSLINIDYIYLLWKHIDNDIQKTELLLDIHLFLSLPYNEVIMKMIQEALCVVCCYCTIVTSS